METILKIPGFDAALRFHVEDNQLIITVENKFNELPIAIIYNGGSPGVCGPAMYLDLQDCIDNQISDAIDYVTSVPWAQTL